MSVTIKRQDPKPAPLPPIETVTARDAHAGPDGASLEVSTYTVGSAPCIRFRMYATGHCVAMSRILSNTDAIELAFAILEMTGVRDMCAKRTYDGKGRL